MFNSRREYRQAGGAQQMVLAQPSAITQLVTQPNPASMSHYMQWENEQSNKDANHTKWGILMVKSRQINPITGVFGRYLDDGTWISHHRFSCVPPCLCEKCFDQRIELVGYFYAVLPPHHGLGHGPLLGADGRVAAWVVEIMNGLDMPTDITVPHWAPHQFFGPYFSSFLPYEIPQPSFGPSVNPHAIAAFQANPRAPSVGSSFNVPRPVPQKPVAGVIRIDEPPYGVTRNQIHAVCGNHSGIVEHADGQLLIHIIMDRRTSKTGEIYVEFDTLREAENVITRLSNTRNRQPIAKLLDRDCRVRMSSQDELMRALFPSAKCTWFDGKPIFNIARVDGTQAFTSFLDKEEIHFLKKYMQDSRKAKFCKFHPQRPFDCITSTLQKYPWGYYEEPEVAELWRAAVPVAKIALEDRMKRDPTNYHFWHEYLRCLIRGGY